jgi:hypothetical protein
MTPRLSRRELLKLLGAAGAGSLLPLGQAEAESTGAVAGDAGHAAQSAASTVGDVARRITPQRPAYPDGEIFALGSTSDVYVPPRGNSFFKFSFDFPEPSVAFGGHRFGFLVFTPENTYGLDRSKLRVEKLDAGTAGRVGAGGAQSAAAETNGGGVAADIALRLVCDGFVWAGGQQTAPGRLEATFRRAGDIIEWDVVAQLEHPIRNLTTIVRDVPRGRLALAGGTDFDPKDDEVLAGYAFGAGDLFTSRSIATPLALVQPSAGDPGDVFFASSLDDRVRPKRFYFQPGESAYRLELVHEHDAWRDDTRITVPRWRIGRAASADAAVAMHVAHLEAAYGLKSWAARDDVAPWMRRIALVITLHGMHWTGYVFNDFAGMLEILKWVAVRIDAHRVLVFLPAWDGRYYWSYPEFVVSQRMGGESGLRRLMDEAHRMGFRMMPMFGANAANRNMPSWPKIEAGATRKIDGNIFYLDWVDWNNDRHNEGFGTYMNLGADAWRQWLEARIADAIERYGADAYFLDIVGGHVNSTNGDMHEGTRRLVMDLRRRYPHVLCVGEMPYDALHGFIAVYQAGNGAIWRKYSVYFEHLSTPAPGRGSSGVHESGFGRFDPKTLDLRPEAIPTLQVVDDTFREHRDVMEAVIRRAKERAGTG